MFNMGGLELLAILAIVILIFGTKKLKNIGGDLGGAIKNFKKSMSDEEEKSESEQLEKSEATEESAAKEAEKQV